MIEIKGKYNTAKIFTDTVEDGAIEQIKALCDEKQMADSIIRIMPDVHKGTDCTIGTTMTIKDRVVPSMVGVDIGCGMYTVKLKQKNINLKQLDTFIHEFIPSGFNIRKTYSSNIYLTNVHRLCCRNHIDGNRAAFSLGTLGGGNHFIEIDIDDEKNLYLIIHSGSRHLGLEVANYYTKLGKKHNEEIKQLVTEYKLSGRQTEIEATIKEMKCSFPYVTGEKFFSYLTDVQIVQEYAKINREIIAEEIINAMGLSVDWNMHTVHNYIDIHNKILRKGAVSASFGESLLIPINMRDGSLLCIGRGNNDWNKSAPHGAGRLMSRRQARETLSIEQFKHEMTGIYTTSVCADTLDEAPDAYKNADELLKCIEPTVHVIKKLKPVYNFKSNNQ